jgi:hypothetical protein
MLVLVRSLSRIASRLRTRLSELWRWLVPVHVSDDERIVRAIYSPYHVKKNQLKHQAYDPTPKTDEISVMRFEHMGTRSCKSKAKSLEDPPQHRESPAQQKVYRGFAVLRTSVVRDSTMEVVDSRRRYCGHADIKLLMPELRTLEPGEPPSAELGKKLKDLKADLLRASSYVPDPNPQRAAWRGANLEPPS